MGWKGDRGRHEHKEKPRNERQQRKGGSESRSGFWWAVVAAGHNVKDVMVFDAAQGVAARLVGFFKVFDGERCEQGLDGGPGVVAGGADRGPVVAVAEELAGEAAAGAQ